MRTFAVIAYGMNPERAFKSVRIGNGCPLPRYVMIGLPSGMDPYEYADQLLAVKGTGLGVTRAGCFDLLDGKYLFFGRQP